VVTAIFILANNIDGIFIAPKIVGESVGLPPAHSHRVRSRLEFDFGRPVRRLARRASDSNNQSAPETLFSGPPEPAARFANMPQTEQRFVR
jgi:hypothetical protein